MTNQLLEPQFIEDACLSEPLPTQWFHLPAKAIQKRLLAWLLVLIPASVGFVGFHWLTERTLPLWSLAVLAIMLLNMALVPWLTRHTRYVLRSADLVLQRGIIWRKATLIPLSRIQHVSIHQSMLQKQFQLATFKIYTAGGMDAEVALADVEYSVAWALSNQLSQLIHAEEQTDDL